MFPPERPQLLRTIHSTSCRNSRCLGRITESRHCCDNTVMQKGLTRPSSVSGVALLRVCLSFASHNSYLASLRQGRRGQAWIPLRHTFRWKASGEQSLGHWGRGWHPPLVLFWKSPSADRATQASGLWNTSCSTAINQTVNQTGFSTLSAPAVDFCSIILIVCKILHFILQSHFYS